MSTRRPDREGVGCGRNKFRKVVTVFLDRATVDGLVCWTGGDEMLFRVLDFPFFLRKKPLRNAQAPKNDRVSS